MDPEQLSGSLQVEVSVFRFTGNSPASFDQGEPAAPVNLPAKTLTSLGVGVRYRFLRWALGEFDWGVPLSSVVEPFGNSLQDHSIHFRLLLGLLSPPRGLRPSAAGKLRVKLPSCRADGPPRGVAALRAAQRLLSHTSTNSTPLQEDRCGSRC
jgi:hypothetical protein